MTRQLDSRRRAQNRELLIPAPAAPRRAVQNFEECCGYKHPIFNVATLYKTITSGRKCQGNIKGENCEHGKKGRNGDEAIGESARCRRR